MSQTAIRFSEATTGFGGFVHEVPADGWSKPTPCSEWTVHDLVNHMTGEHLWAPLLLAGKTIAEVGSQFDGDLLGSNATSVWDQAARESIAAVNAPGALEGTVHLSYGDDSATGYIGQMTLDALIHGWDLARAIGVVDVMPAELVSWAIDQVEPMLDLITASGLFGTPLPVAHDADPQTRLLAMLGRDAGWREP